MSTDKTLLKKLLGPLGRRLALELANTRGDYQIPYGVGQQLLVVGNGTPIATMSSTNMIVDNPGTAPHASTPAAAVDTMHWDNTNKYWCIDRDGVFAFYGVSLGTPGSCTDGNIQMLTVGGTNDPAGFDASRESGMSIPGVPSTTFGLTGTKGPMLPGGNGTTFAELTGIVYLQKGMKFRIGTRMQYSGSPVTPPTITRIQHRLIKVG